MDAEAPPDAVDPEVPALLLPANRRVARVGFTGTKDPGQITVWANRRLNDYFASITMPWELHHGDCIGADETAHVLARRHGARIIGHPPTNDALRAHCSFDAEMEARPYKERNRNIVDVADIMIGLPKRTREELRSGTWMTIRYAWRTGTPTYTIWPNGAVSYLAGIAAHPWAGFD